MVRIKQHTFLYTSGFGCLLPVLVCANLFFGWLILPVLFWILLELLLIFGLFYSTFFIAQRIKNISREQKEIIDVEGRREE